MAPSLSRNPDVIKQRMRRYVGYHNQAHGDVIGQVYFVVNVAKLLGIQDRKEIVAFNSQLDAAIKHRMMVGRNTNPCPPFRLTESDGALVIRQNRERTRDAADDRPEDAYTVFADALCDVLKVADRRFIPTYDAMSDIIPGQALPAPTEAEIKEACLDFGMRMKELVALPSLLWLRARAKAAGENTRIAGENDKVRQRVTTLLSHEKVVDSFERRNRQLMAMLVVVGKHVKVRDAIDRLMKAEAETKKQKFDFRHVDRLILSPKFEMQTDTAIIFNNQWKLIHVAWSKVETGILLILQSVEKAACRYTVSLAAAKPKNNLPNESTGTDSLQNINFKLIAAENDVGTSVEMTPTEVDGKKGSILVNDKLMRSKYADFTWSDPPAEQPPKN